MYKEQISFTKKNRRCVDSKFVKLSDELIIFIESQEDILNKQKNRSNVYMANYLPRCR